MKIDKVRKLAPKELTAEIAKVKEQIVQLTAEVAMHRVKNWRALSAAKKYLARLLTVHQEQMIIKSI